MEPYNNLIFHNKTHQLFLEKPRGADKISTSTHTDNTINHARTLSGSSNIVARLVLLVVAGLVDGHGVRFPLPLH